MTAAIAAETYRGVPFLVRLGHMPKPTVPPELLQFYLPGLLLARQTLDEKISSVRLAAGIAPETPAADLLNDDLEPLALVPERRGHKTWTDEQRRQQSEIQKKLWRKRRKMPLARSEDLIAWAREHGGVFDRKAFKKEHPDANALMLGNLTRHNVFVRNPKQKHIYKLVE